MTKPALRGTLKTWKEDRGFGFIVPDNGGRDVFLHISAIAGASRRPVPGDVIHYQVARDKHGKFRAVNVSIEGITTQANKSAAAQEPEKSKLTWVIVGAITLLLIAAGLAFVYFRAGGFNF